MRTTTWQQDLALAGLSLLTITLLATVDPFVVGLALYHKINHLSVIVTVSLSNQALLGLCYALARVT